MLTQSVQNLFELVGVAFHFHFDGAEFVLWGKIVQALYMKLFIVLIGHDGWRSCSR